jgi:hypothetical protein
MRCSWRAPPLGLLVVPLGPRVFWLLWLLRRTLWMVGVECLGYVCGLDDCLSNGGDLLSGRFG